MRMSHSGAYISRYGDFSVNDDNSDDTTGYYTHCACVQATIEGAVTIEGEVTIEGANHRSKH